MKRSDFPGPSDGFYDAVKPVTFALIAGVQAKAGDQSAAVVHARRGGGPRPRLKAEDQKLIAQIVIAQKNAACGRRDAASAVVAEALPLALTQPEPRRSRVLTMLADAQVQAGDADGALRHHRRHPRLPGAREGTGLDRPGALARGGGRHRDLRGVCAPGGGRLEAKAPEKPLPGKVMTLNAFSRDTFIDFDLELTPELATFQRKQVLQGLLARRGEVEAAIREAKAGPPERRDFALSQLVGSLAGNGDVDRAMDLAESIQSPGARMQAFVALAGAIPERPAKK